MRQSHRLLAGALVAVVACQETPPLFPATAPENIREACALAERKCTACHERDRIVDARHTVTEWRTTVERMRRFPGSGITPADTEVILRCVSYNSDAAVLAPVPLLQSSLR
ncbi:MAG: hypothetical protein ABI867_31935 [Kofleriaceae bacterium]